MAYEIENNIADKDLQFEITNPVKALLFCGRTFAMITKLSDDKISPPNGWNFKEIECDLKSVEVKAFNMLAETTDENGNQYLDISDYLK